MGIIINGQNDTIGPVDNSMSLLGTVSIGGTMTIEDFTNIDSVGLITARNGVNVTAGDVNLTSGNLALASATPMVVASNGSGHLRLGAGGSEKVRITSAGNVGINDTNPTAKLSVNGNLYVSSDSFTGENSGIFFSGWNDYGAGVYGRNSGNDLVMNAGASEKVRITSAGKVGIRTDAPKQVFSVVGRSNFDIQGDYYGAWIDGDSQGSSSFNVGVWHNAGGTMRNEGNHLVLETKNTSHWIQLQPSGGNISVGSNNPNGLLALTAASGRLLTLRNSTTGSASGDGSYLALNGSDFQIANAEAANVILYTADTERLRINSNGATVISNAGTFPTSTNETLNIQGEGHNGHGTSNTRSVFNVTGAITSNTNAAGLWIGARTNENTAVIGTRTASGNLAIETYNGGWGERLRITSAGFVGINEGNPATHLHVEQDNAHSSSYYLNTDAAILVDNKNASGKTVIKLEHDAALVYGAGSSSFVISDRQNERLHINSSGYVGINDASPSKLLTVNRGTGSDGDLVDFKNDEVSLRFGVWGTGATYSRECTINSTRQDGGSYPRLRLAGQDGIRFCSDLNNVRGNLNAYGEWRIGTGNDNLYSTDQVHSIGNLNFGVTSNLARLVMQERQSNWIAFKDGSSNHYGTISRNGSGVSYGSNSDYRLKDNVQNFTSGIELVKRLRPVTFNWNVLSGQEDTTTIHRGFLAHEVQEIEPGAVDGLKDGMDRVGDCTNAEGVVTQKNVYESQAKDGETWTLVSEEIRDQQLDPAKLVPILTAGLKEAIAKIETLEAAVAALQGS